MIDHNKNFGSETHCYFNEDTQEWIPYGQLETYTKEPFRNAEKMKMDLDEWRKKDLEKYGKSQIKEQIFEQWGTMSNKEIKAMNEIEQPTLF